MIWTLVTTGKVFVCLIFSVFCLYARWCVCLLTKKSVVLSTSSLYDGQRSVLPSLSVVVSCFRSFQVHEDDPDPK